MKSTLSMALFSRRLMTESFAREQITALSSFGGGLVRPDKCSRVEPIRAPFDPADISVQVGWLAGPQGQFFYRKGRPAHVAGEIWNLIHPPTARFPSPIFSSRWTGRFDGNWSIRVGIERVEEFVSEMFRVTSSDFGLLTTKVDLECKNTFTPGFSFQGFDVARGIPGLYWINLFSDDLARWLGLITTPKELAALNRLAGGGWLLKFCESPDQCRIVDILQKQRAAIEWLGTERFFDIRLPDRKLEAPDWNSASFRNAESKSIN